VPVQSARPAGRPIAFWDPAQTHPLPGDSARWRILTIVKVGNDNSHHYLVSSPSCLLIASIRFSISRISWATSLAATPSRWPALRSARVFTMCWRSRSRASNGLGLITLHFWCPPVPRPHRRGRFHLVPITVEKRPSRNDSRAAILAYRSRVLTSEAAIHACPV